MRSSRAPSIVTSRPCVSRHVPVRQTSSHPSSALMPRMMAADVHQRQGTMVP